MVAFFAFFHIEFSIISYTEGVLRDIMVGDCRYFESMGCIWSGML